MTTRIGLVGYGFGGRVFHAPLLAAASGVEFAGVVTRSPERRAELRHDHPGTPAFDSLADLAAAGAQAVAISTPAPTHIPLALEAIELGLAVVVDKPFALDAAQARTARRGRRGGRRGAQRLPEPALGLGPADRPAPAGERGARRGHAVRVELRALRGRRAGAAPRAAASCATSAATSSTRRCCCSARWRRCTARCGPGARRALLRRARAPGRHDVPPQRRLDAGRARSALSRARERRAPTSSSAWTARRTR